MTKRERFLWSGYTYAQMQAWKREREELRNGEKKCVTRLVVL
jgi:hypothetical protein